MSYVPSIVNPNQMVVRNDATEPITFPLTKEGLMLSLGHTPSETPSGHPLNDDGCVEAVECKKLGFDAVVVHQSVARVEKGGIQTRYRISSFGRKINKAYDIVKSKPGDLPIEKVKEAMAFLLDSVGKEITFNPYTLAESHSGPHPTQSPGSRPQRERKPTAEWRRNGTGQSRAVNFITAILRP